MSTQQINTPPARNWSRIGTQLTSNQQLEWKRLMTDEQKIFKDSTMNWRSLDEHSRTTRKQTHNTITQQWQMIGKSLTIILQPVDKPRAINPQQIQKQSIHKQLHISDWKARNDWQTTSNQSTIICHPTCNALCRIEKGAAGWELMSPPTVGCSLRRFMRVHRAMVQAIVLETLKRSMWSNSTPTVSHMSTSKVSWFVLHANCLTAHRRRELGLELAKHGPGQIPVQDQRQGVSFGPGPVQVEVRMQFPFVQVRCRVLMYD